MSVKLDLSILELWYAKKSFDGFKFSGKDIQRFSVYSLLEKITSSWNQVSFHFGLNNWCKNFPLVRGYAGLEIRKNRLIGEFLLRCKSFPPPTSQYFGNLNKGRIFCCDVSVYFIWVFYSSCWKAIHNVNSST